MSNVSRDATEEIVDSGGGLRSNTIDERVEGFVRRACDGVNVGDNLDAVVDTLVRESLITLGSGASDRDIMMAVVNAALQNVHNDILFNSIARNAYLMVLYADILGCEYDRCMDDEEFKRLYREKFVSFIKDNIEEGVLRQDLLEIYDLEKVAEKLVPERDYLLDYIGLSTISHRYALNGACGNCSELPQFVFMRVGMGLALKEDNPLEMAERFYEKFSKLMYLPGGSTLLGASTRNVGLSNCFLIEVQDDIEHIAKSVADVIKISKASGGIGLSLTQLRCAGSRLVSSGSVSSGPIPFSKIFDSAIAAIVRGGKKKGALAAYMEPWHLDFRLFLDLRNNAGDDYMRFRVANTACLLPDEFIKRVKNDDWWYYFDPNEVRDLIDLYGSDFSKRYAEYCEMAEAGKLRMWDKEKAADVFRRILVSLVSTSHPWITFKCPINLRALNNNTGTIKMSNLCTEICLPESRTEIAVCNLCSVNIVRHIKSVEDREIDWDLLRDTVRTGIRHLDNLIDVNNLPIEEARRSDSNNRAVGMGVMGIADMLEKFGLPYDSEEALDLVDKVFEFVSYCAIEASADLAQERGAYANFEGSMWSKGFVPMDTIAKLEEDRGMELKVKKGSLMGLDWDSLREKVKKGMRNATVMAVAPNANIGLVAGTTPGIDVRFAQIFSRSKFSGTYVDLNPNLVRDLKKLGIWEEVRGDLLESRGDISEIDIIPDNLKSVYKTSFSTSPYAVLEMAGRAQKWVDQAISRNMYLRTRDIGEIKDIYLHGWELGIKTTYYLHMEPRHSNEQSVVSVNKAKKLGKLGFAKIKKKKKAESSVRDDKVETDFKGCPIDPALRNQCDSCQ